MIAFLENDDNGMYILNFETDMTFKSARYNSFKMSIARGNLI